MIFYVIWVQLAYCVIYVNEDQMASHHLFLDSVLLCTSCMSFLAGSIRSVPPQELYGKWYVDLATQANRVGL